MCKITDQAALANAHAANLVNWRAQALLPTLLPELIPGGRFEGARYLPRNPTRKDQRPGSFTINSSTGEWGEFAKGYEATGTDVISLVKYIQGFTQAADAVSFLDTTLRTLQLTDIQRKYRPRPRGEPIIPIPPDKTTFVSDPEFGSFVCSLVPGHEPVEAFGYENSLGQLLFLSVRFRHPTTGTKTYRPAAYVRFADGSQGWSSQHPDDLAPLFNLKDLSSRPDAPVLVCEGERAAESARQLFPDHVVVTSANGAGAARQTDWSPLRDRHVAIWPDNDKAGAGYAYDVAELATGAGARSVRTVLLPDNLPDGWDLADEIPSGLDPRAFLAPMQTISQETANRTVPIGCRALATTTPFVFTDPRAIAPRELLYGPYQRRFLSALVAPPKTGKTVLITAESLAMVTGRDLLGIKPFEPLRVWIASEDPRDELQRRIVGAAIHYNIGHPDLEGRLFVDSFREKKLIVAEKTSSSIVINFPLVSALVDEIGARRIDHLFIDPFVSTHRVPENDNGAMADAAQAWNEVADKANCSICLVHHTRKMNGAEVTVDDMRGGSSLLGVVRSVRTLNQMSESEVKKLEIEPEERPRYIKIGAGASNMFAPSDRSTWFFLKSVDLGNQTLSRPSDHVGVAAPWSWPAPQIPDVMPAQLLEILKGIASGTNKENVQSSGWAGKAVAEVLRLDASDPKDKAAIKSMLKRWENDGTLKIVKAYDKKRGRDVPEYRVEKWDVISSLPTS